MPEVAGDGAGTATRYTPATMVELTFLGTGTSNGVPIIGCDCAVCRSSDPRDARTRSSAVLRAGNVTLLIDTATELRTQALRARLDRIDAVLMTHAHADHTGGFDDLRRFNEMQQEWLSVYCNRETAEMLRDRYAYTFVEQYPFFGGKPDLRLVEVDDPFVVDAVEVIPIPMLHGRLPILGFRAGDLAYLTDAKTIPESSRALLVGVDTLVINALRERQHPTHFNFDEALEFIDSIGPRQAFLTHISHETSHADIMAKMPDSVMPAHDGLTICSREPS
jgi:phosphoribosyl 1,2-cyclic phosphate phosphodiesterase